MVVQGSEIVRGNEDFWGFEVKSEFRFPLGFFCLCVCEFFVWLKALRSNGRSKLETTEATTTIFMKERVRQMCYLYNFVCIRRKRRKGDQERER